MRTNIIRLVLSLVFCLPSLAWSQTQVPAINAPLSAPAGSFGAAGAGALGSTLGQPSGLAQQSPSLQLSAPQTQPLPNFQPTIHQMVQTYKTAEKDYAAAVQAVVAIPADKRTFDNTVRALEEASGRYSEAVGPLQFLSHVSPDKQVRRVSEAIERRSDRFALELSDRDDIYKAYKELAAGPAALDLKGEDKKLLEETLRGYKRSGMDLPMSERVNLKGIRQRLNELSQAFGRNLAEHKDFIEVSPDRLAGLPEDYVKGRERTPDGKVRITLDYPSYLPFMTLAKDADLRRQLQFKYYNRAAEKNVPILEEALLLRQRLARKLAGEDKTYADFAIEERMAKSASTVQAFLDRLKKLLQGPAKAEKAALLALKREEVPGAERIEKWDGAYYSDKLLKRLYSFDPEEVRQYFPVDHVVHETLAIYQELLGVRFEEVPQAQTWHPDVKLFRILNAAQTSGISRSGPSRTYESPKFGTADGKPIAHFFVDLHPREGKYGHAAAFTLIQGREQASGVYRMPVSAIVANFSKPVEGKPALLSHDEVETFFHEFGHIMHQTLTQARYTSFSGTSVARDFVEAPSQMMENFVWTPQVLARLSAHWQDRSRKLPPELIQKMISSRRFQAASDALGQVALAAFDLALHTVPAPVDSTAVMERVFQDVQGLTPTPGTHFQAGFGHLMGGYGAGYYGYLWSKVFAQDIYSRFEADGVISPKVGLEYRKAILERGSSVDEAQLIKDFLGREPNEAAFLKMLGVEQAAEKPADEAPAVALVDEKIEPKTLADIKAVLSAHKDVLLPLAGKVRVRFEKHFHPRNPVVLVEGPGGFRTIFYLFEAQERLFKLRFALWKKNLSWRKPSTWLPPMPPGPVDPVTMDVAVQAWEVVQYAQLVATLGK